MKGAFSTEHHPEHVDLDGSRLISSVVLSHVTTSYLDEPIEESGHDKLSEKHQKKEIDPYLQEKSKSLKKRQDAYFSVYDSISVFSAKGVFFGFSGTLKDGLIVLSATQTALLLDTTDGFTFDLNGEGSDSTTTTTDSTLTQTDETQETTATTDQTLLDEGALLADEGSGSGGAEETSLASTGTSSYTGDTTQTDTGALSGTSTTSSTSSSGSTYGSQAATRDLLEGLVTNNVVDFSSFFTDGNDAFNLQDNPEALSYLQTYPAFQLTAKEGNDTIMLTGLDSIYIESVNLHSGDSYLGIEASNSYIQSIRDYGEAVDAKSTVNLELINSYVEAVDLGNLDDTLLIDSDFSSFEAIVLGGGDDTLLVEGTGNFFSSISGGAGEDEIVINTSLSGFGSLTAGSGDDIVNIQVRENALNQLLLGAGNDALYVKSQTDSLGAVNLGAGDDKFYVAIEEDYTGARQDLVQVIVGGEAEETAGSVTSFSTTMVLASTLDAADGFYDYQLGGDSFIVQFATTDELVNYLSLNSFTDTSELDTSLDGLDVTSPLLLSDAGLGLSFALEEMENLVFVLEDPYLFAGYFTEGDDTFTLSNLSAEEMTLFTTVGGAYIDAMAGADTLVIDQAQDVFFGVMDLAEGVGNITFDTLTNVKLGTLLTGSQQDVITLRDVSSLQINQIQTGALEDVLIVESGKDVSIGTLLLEGGSDTVRIFSPTTLINSSLSLGAGEDVVQFYLQEPFTPYTQSVTNQVVGGETEEQVSRVEEVTDEFIVASTRTAVDGFNTYDLAGDLLEVRFTTFSDYKDYLSSAGFATTANLDTYLKGLNLLGSVDLSSSTALNLSLTEMEAIFFVVEEADFLSSYFTEGDDTFLLTDLPDVRELLQLAGQGTLLSLGGSDTIFLDQLQNFRFPTIDLSEGVNTITLQTLTNAVIGEFFSGTGADTFNLENFTNVTIDQFYTGSGQDIVTITNADGLTINDLQLQGGHDRLYVTASNSYFGTIQEHTGGVSSNAIFTLDLTDSYVGSLLFAAGKDSLTISGSDTTYGYWNAGAPDGDTWVVNGSRLTFETVSFYASVGGNSIAFSVAGAENTFTSLSFVDGNDTLSVEGTGHTLTEFAAGGGNDVVLLASERAIVGSTLALGAGHDRIEWTISSAFTPHSGVSTNQVVGGETSEATANTVEITDEIVIASTNHSVVDFTTYDLAGDTLWLRFASFTDYFAYLSSAGFSSSGALDAYLETIDFTQTTDLSSTLGLNATMAEMEHLLVVIEETDFLSGYFTEGDDLFVLDTETLARDTIEASGFVDLSALGGSDQVTLNTLSNTLFKAVHLGEGTNTLTLSEISVSQMTSVTSGAGADTFNLENLTNVTIEEFYTGSGKDIVTMTNADGLTINDLQLQGGHDELYVTASNSYFGTIQEYTGGLSSNSVFNLNLTNSYVGSLLFGAGRDSLTISGSDTTYAYWNAGAPDGDTWVVNGNRLTFETVSFYASVTGNSLTFSVSGDDNTFTSLSFVDGTDTLSVTGTGHTLTQFVAGSGSDTVSLSSTVTLTNSSLQLQGGDDLVNLTVTSSYSAYTGASTNEVVGGETEESSSLNMSDVVVVAASEAAVSPGVYNRAGDTLLVRFANVTDYFNYLTVVGWASAEALETALGQIDFTQRVDLSATFGFNVVLEEMEQVFFVLEEVDFLNDYFTEGDDTFLLNTEPSAKDLLEKIGSASFSALGGADTIVLDQLTGVSFTLMDLGAGDNALTLDTLSSLAITTITAGDAADTLLLEGLTNVTINNLLLGGGTNSLTLQTLSSVTLSSVTSGTGADTYVLDGMNTVTIDQFLTGNGRDIVTITNADDLTINNLQLQGGHDRLYATANHSYFGTIQEYTGGSSSNAIIDLDLTNSYVGSILLAAGRDQLYIDGADTTYNFINAGAADGDTWSFSGARLTFNTLSFYASPSGNNMTITIQGEGHQFGSFATVSGHDLIHISGDDHRFTSLSLAEGNDRVYVNGSAIFDDLQAGSGADLIEVSGVNGGIDTGVSTFTMGDGSDLIVFSVSSLREGIVIDGGTLDEGAILSSHLSTVQGANELFATTTVDATTTGDTLLLLFQDQVAYDTFLTNQGVAEQEFEQAMTDLVASGATPYDLNPVGLDIEATSIENVVIGTL